MNLKRGKILLPLTKQYHFIDSENQNTKKKHSLLSPCSFFLSVYLFSLYLLLFTILLHTYYLYISSTFPLELCAYFYVDMIFILPCIDLAYSFVNSSQYKRSMKPYYLHMKLSVKVYSLPMMWGKRYPLPKPMWGLK